MIVRVGDEKRDMRDEHLTKLKTFFIENSADPEIKETASSTLLSCVGSLPHKSQLYASLISMIAIENKEFVREFLESLMTAL